MKNRIIEIRNCVGKNGKKMTQDDFAKRLNLSRNFINQVEVGTKNPSDRTILDICREFGVNEDWLRYGKGEMFISESREGQLARLTADLFMESPTSFKNKFVSLLAKMSDEDWELLENMVDKLANKKE